MKTTINLLSIGAVLMILLLAHNVAELFYFNETHVIAATITEKSQIFDESSVQEINYIYVLNIKKSVSLNRFKNTHVGDLTEVIEKRGTLFGFFSSIEIK